MTITVDLARASADQHTRRTLSEISLAVAKSKKIVVVTGAGISCSCGIPDFRSSDGLYALVKQRYPDIVLKGRDLFDASLFRDATSTSVFYTFISQLKRSIDAASPTPTHHFIKTLDTKKKLLRSYTQNIDGLEARIGILCSSEAKSNLKGKEKMRSKDVRNIQLHGDIHRVHCMSCSAEYPCSEDHMRLFNDGLAPDCPECLSRRADRMARSARPIRVGSLRPSIVLYDEPHPHGDDISDIQTADVSKKPDLLIIMGTSLKVHGLKKLVKEFARTVRAASPSSTTAKSSKAPCKVIFVNMTSPGADWGDIIDYHVSGETDQWVGRVIEDWKKMRPADWEIQQTLISSDNVNSGFKVAKNATGTLKKGSRNKNNLKEVENVAPSRKGAFLVNSSNIPPSQKRRRTDSQCAPVKRRCTIQRT
ncbi:DHS-like NAD/FAD-binding domain-containing protein [Cyathus striatus]|nr:DHS-like NAD/FAD-binding domain-containing protein [Cyathus striatus]